jgi:hypothetical protein
MDYRISTPSDHSRLADGHQGQETTGRPRHRRYEKQAEIGQIESAAT